MARSGWLTFRAALLYVLLALLAISAIGVSYPPDFLWEHVLTAVAIGLLIWLELTGRRLSNISCLLIFLYLSIHVLGAHYTYSEVPYDRWSQQIFGMSLSEMFGQSRGRNHFDRFVHFIFGILILHPIRELVQRGMKVRALHAIVIAGAFIVVMGTLYEILEWLYAAMVGAEMAEHYNGQQGDMFDAQKDIVLNVLGTLIGGGASAAVSATRWGKVHV